MSKKIGFFPAGGISWGSSRIRVFWIAPLIDNAIIIEPINGKMEIPDDIDVLVFQKIFNEPAARWAKENGKKVIWDTCDPAWWFQDISFMFPFVDAVVCSSGGLLHDFRSNFKYKIEKYGIKTRCIDDTVNLEHYTERKVHVENSYKLIWFGVAVNRVALYGALPTLERIRVVDGIPLSLTIFDDRPGLTLEPTANIPISYMHWKLDWEIEVLQQHDIALLPLYPGEWGLVKSENKKLTAWANGLPVTNGTYELTKDLLTNAAMRESYSKENRKWIERSGHTEVAAEEWRILVDEI